jgi:phage terminase small subunit
MALNARQQRFVDEYLVDLDAPAAYRRAGYRPCNDNAASAAASRLLNDVNVRAAVAAAQQEQAARLLVSQDDVIRGLHVEATDRGAHSRASARVRAWELLGKHLGMFRDRLDVSASILIQTVAGIDEACVLGLDLVTGNGSSEGSRQ